MFQGTWNEPVQIGFGVLLVNKYREILLYEVAWTFWNAIEQINDSKTKRTSKNAFRSSFNVSNEVKRDYY